MKETGVAPHYTEIADTLQLPVEEARQQMRQLLSGPIPDTWLAPETDYIASFASFSNLPTQYRISVEGENKWFGQ